MIHLASGGKKDIKGEETGKLISGWLLIPILYSELVRDRELSFMCSHVFGNK